MKTSLILIALLSIVVGCDAIDAMKATKDMKSATNSMNDKMDKTNLGIQETNDSVRKQKLILSINDMLDDKNTQDLEPVALGMIAGAEEFGKSATTEETIKYVFKLLLEIKDVKPKESLKDANGNFPANVVEAYDHLKMIKLSQIYSIAGFYPQDKLDQIVNEQIYGGGRYQREAYIFLMARVQFLGTYLQETLLAEPLDTVEAMRELVVRLGAIDSILKSPFKAKVKMNIDTFIAKEPIVAALYDDNGNMEDSWNAPKLWKKAFKRFDQDLKDGNIVEGSSVKSTDVEKEIVQLKASVQTYLNSWK
ncbi:MAG: hypothetical protein PHY93_08365 [Bacteriovorax sp.]|nr:hypothetical protein [Bacteriovorax sp.]